MATGSKKRRFMSRSFNGGLILLLLLQIYVFGSFSLNGYCRVYAPACEWLLNQSIPDAFKLRISEVRVYPNARLEMMWLEIRSQDPAVQTVRIDSAQIAMSSRLNAKVQLRLNKIAISRPSFTSPPNTEQGLVNPIMIDFVRLDVLKKGPRIHVPSMTVMAGTWTLRGSVEPMNLHALKPTDENAIDWPLLYSKVDEWIQQYHNIATNIKYEQPIVQFCVEQRPNGALDVAARLTVEEAHFAGNQLSELDVRFDYASSTPNNVPKYTLMFKIGDCDFNRTTLQLNGKCITGFSQSTKTALSKGLENHIISVHSPQVVLNQGAQFSLSTMELKITDTGLVNMQGTCFLEQLIENMPANLVRFEGCSFGKAPQIDFCLDYSLENAMLHKFDGELKVSDLLLQSLSIDRVYSAFSWLPLSQEIRLHQALIQRGQERVQLEGTVHLERKDYNLTVEAYAIPTAYNTIMPDWWKKTFRDVQFLEQATCDANFEVVGRFGQRIADFFYGSVHAKNLAYRGVPIDSCQLQLRGRQHYSEISQLVVQQGAHSAHGSIHIASLPDPIKAPLFWSIDVDSSFPLEAYKKLVNPTVAAQIQAFKANQSPEVRFKGKFFTRHYPQYRPYMHFQMYTDSRGPIYYKNIPFDSLQFKLGRNAERLTIYDLDAKIANGRAVGQIDFHWKPDRSTSMQIKADLQQCDTKKLLSMFHEEERAALSNLAPPEESSSKIDLAIHLKGPSNNWLEFDGYGRAAIQDKALGSIKLLGPLSSILLKTPLNFTSLKFQTLNCNFQLTQKSLNFAPLTIAGHSSQIKMKGDYNLELDSLDMHATLHPLINYVDKLNPVTQLNKLIQIPFSPFFKFKLDGSLKNPRWRSIMDPRVLLPIF